MKKAVIFDLDGVLVSTDRLHYAAWEKLTGRLGIPFDEGVYHRLRGLSRMDSLDIVLAQGDKTWTAEERTALAGEKNRSYLALAERLSPADVDPDVTAALESLRAKGVALAVGSSSKNAGLILDRTGLRGYFDAVADGNGIRRAKPDPEVFLKAAALLEVAPEEALVVEDAAAGIRAAHDGGFESVAFGGDAVDSPLPHRTVVRLTELLDLF